MVSTEYLNKLIAEFISGRISSDHAKELFEILNETGHLLKTSGMDVHGME